jgi:hypothetical protein
MDPNRPAAPPTDPGQLFAVVVEIRDPVRGEVWMTMAWSMVCGWADDIAMHYAEAVGLRAEVWFQGERVGEFSPTVGGSVGEHRARVDAASRRVAAALDEVNRRLAEE